MNKPTTLLGTAVLSALAGGGIVWSVMRDSSSAPSTGSPQEGGPETSVEVRRLRMDRVRLDRESGEADTERPRPTKDTAAGGAGSAGSDAAAGKEGGQQADSGTDAGSAEIARPEQGNPTTARHMNLPAQATLIDQVVVPVPSEVFAVLDKVGKPQWKDVSRPLNDTAKPRGGSVETALLLGYVIAEGFVAVEAQDAERVKEIGRSVLSLGEAIGVRKAVLRRSNAIVEAAERRDWPRVRKEFDGALADVKEVLVELNSAVTADLVSLGGWIRGTDALASVVRGDYNPDTADLLHQPGLVDYFADRISSLPKGTQELPILNTVQKGLSGIRPLMGTGNGPVPKESVEKIGQLTANLVQQIGGTVSR